MLDTDDQPLLQAADFIAYMAFRRALFESRRQSLPFNQIESFVLEAERLTAGRPLFSVNTVQIITNNRMTQENQALHASARYAVAHHLLCSHEKEEQTVRAFFATPEDFLQRCHQAYSLAISPQYLPILKDGVLERWEASGKSDDFDLNGEDRP